MPLVKSIWVKITSTGASETKRDINDVAEAARRLSDDEIVLKMTVADKMALVELRALGLEMRALRKSGADLGDVRARIGGIGDAATNTTVKLAALRLALDSLDGGAGTGGGGRGGFGGGFLRGFAGFFGNLPLPAQIAGIGLLVTAVSQLSSVIPVIVSAGMGMAAFGGLAYPTITAISGAVTKLSADTAKYRAAVGDVAKDKALKQIQADWAAIPPGQREVVKGIQQIETTFSNIATKFAPVVLPIFNNLLKAVRNVLPYIQPFAQAAASALGPLSKQFATFLGSQNFQNFLAPLLKLTGPAIKTIGQGLGDIGLALLQFLKDTANPNGLMTLKALLLIVAGAIRTLGWVFKTWNGIAIPAITGVTHAFMALGDWIKALPGKVHGWLSALPGELRQLGVNILKGLIGGMQSMIPGLHSVVGTIAGGILGTLSGLFKTGSPSKVTYQLGRWVAEGLANGIRDGMADYWGGTLKQVMAHLLALRQYALGIAGQMVSWASLTSAATGLAYTNPIAGSTVYSHIAGGVTTGGNGVVAPTGPGMLRNLRLDLGRLRAFAGVLKRLQRMGLDRTLMAQIIAAGPDQGYQIGEAILDAGRGNVNALNRTEASIYGVSRRIGLTAAGSQFAGGTTLIVNFPNLLAGNPRQIAREIQKLLADLKRHNGGAALGIG